jgi:NAD(P)-dependent dehydrogenase (short-subunit alcohol dehydrogenase family)
MNNKIVVITGSTRGFGFAIAAAMLQAGATVVISGRSETGVKRAVESLRKLGTVSGQRCDVRDERQVYSLAKRAINHHGRIDVWINNAGSSTSAGMILDTPPKQALEMFLVNDMGTIHGTQVALHFMLPRKQGTLVNIYGNGSFLRPASPTGLYGASKAWVTSFTRTLAKEIAGSGVHLIGFSPGMLLTDMLTKPTVTGKNAQHMMRNYDFVLRLLSGSPDRAAEQLVSLVRSNRREFVEQQLFKPWSPILGMLRIGWENLTHTGHQPEFTLTIKPGYKPRI